MAVLPRLLLALACGAGIGLNRDLRHKPAGFRTFGLVSVGAALITITAETLSGSDPAAVSRVVQGVVTGIGFLGAGMIYRRAHGRPVSGLTTAAAVWSTAGLGIACGLGLYPLAIAALAVILLVLIAGGPIERRLERLLEREARDASRPTNHGQSSDAP
jgi:putative Mg2+ transporter-C (MgtC) family protein